MSADIENFNRAKNSIALQINRHLGLTGTSIKKLSKLSGVGASTIRSIQARHANPSLLNLIKLEHVMGKKLTIEF